ncbi:S8 family peptidase [Aquimarina mytili]|uniref:S8/S53 family peptidase n=1 Tax=Aquimarina mytili TaxID=874423 RepID=A0A936ZS78_9FLAO|nr:S8/S53 family peptidase [Aquimarina mytili]MBL0683347.1 S8/S53 family peptidase [Aquimarina mytili]
MKKIALFAIGLILVFSCSKDDPNEIIDPNSNSFQSQELLSKKVINDYIESQLRQYGDVKWMDAPDDMLYSAVMHGGGILSIGFGYEGESFSIEKSSRLIDAKENIVNIVRSSEDISKSDPIVYDYDVLNAIDVQISDIETIRALKSADQIRYLDPLGYESFLFSNNEIQPKSFGCETGNRTLNTQDYRVISPNAWLPWNFDVHNVPQAWNLSTGAGITIGLIDTGISSSQNLLSSNGFNDGFSTGRTVQRFGTFDGSDSDQCGHGTSMASAMVSPRNDDGMPVGVAYNANLVAYRGTGDVLLNSSRERRGVSNALRQLGDRSDVRIISMSLGYVWSIGSVKDAVRYAHNRGKLIFAAGGTSTSFTNWYPVTFPASMSETVAVTGVKDNGDRCSNCHSGRQIDFTIAMQRRANSDRTVPVIGFNSNTRNMVGGSSVATATTAGIAALVWARNPNMNRDQVLDKLRRAADNYPNRNRRFGYGNIDAFKAVQ